MKVRLPYWLLRLLPMWDYICPRCRRKVSRKTRKCPYCGENYGAPLRVPPRCLKDKKALEDYVHEHIFPKVSASQREYLARFFTEFFSDGFESGDFSAWSGTNGSPETVTNPVYAGSYAAKLDTGTSENIYKNLDSGQTAINVRVYFRYEANPDNWGYSHVLTLRQTSPSAKDLVYLRVYNRGGTITWRLMTYDSGGSWVNTDFDSPTPQPQTWYCVEVHWEANTASGCTLYLDGENLGSTTAATYDGNIQRVICAGYASTNYFDCVVVADTYIGLEGGQTYEVYVDAAVQGFASPVTQTTFNVEKNAAVMGQGLSGRETVFNVMDAAVVSVVSMPWVQSMFNVGSDAVLRVVAEVGVVKEGEVKVTRVFLVLGDLAIQLTGD